MLFLFQSVWKKPNKRPSRDVCSLPLKVLVWNHAGGHEWRLHCLPGEELIRQLKKHIFRYEVGWEGKENFAIGLIILSISTIFFFLLFLCLWFFLLLWFSPFLFLSTFYSFNFSITNPCPSPTGSSARGAQQLDCFTAWKRGCSAPRGGNPTCECSALTLNQVQKDGFFTIPSSLPSFSWGLNPDTTEKSWSFFQESVTDEVSFTFTYNFLLTRSNSGSSDNHTRTLRYLC